MSETDYEKLEKSLGRLKEQYANYLRLDEQCLPPITGEAIKESAIKRFDICYDTLLTHLKKFMEEELGLPEVRDVPVEIFRQAKEGGVIDTAMQKQLNAHRKIRNNSAHTYSEEMAKKTLDDIEIFIEDVAEIYQTMTDWT